MYVCLDEYKTLAGNSYPSTMEANLPDENHRTIEMGAYLNIICSELKSKQTTRDASLAQFLHSCFQHRIHKLQPGFEQVQRGSLPLLAAQGLLTWATCPTIDFNKHFKLYKARIRSLFWFFSTYHDHQLVNWRSPVGKLNCMIPEAEWSRLAWAGYYSRFVTSIVLSQKRKSFRQISMCDLYFCDRTTDVTK